MFWITFSVHQPLQRQTYFITRNGEISTGQFIGLLDIPLLTSPQVLKKADMIRKNAVESILAERDILISVRNPFVVSLCC